jgi:hypothetical protein
MSSTTDSITLDVSWMLRADVIVLLTEAKRLLAIVDAVPAGEEAIAFDAFESVARKLPYCSMASGYTLKKRVRATCVPQ